MAKFECKGRTLEISDIALESIRAKLKTLAAERQVTADWVAPAVDLDAAVDCVWCGNCVFCGATPTPDLEIAIFVGVLAFA